MISIIIPFKGCVEKAKILIDLLREITENKIITPYEIIIVDSSNYLNLSDISERKPIRIIHQYVRTGTARNLGVKEAKGDVLLFIDADCSVPPEFIDYVYNLVMNTEEDVGAIGGPIECVPTTSILQKYLDYSIFTPFPRYQNDYIADWKSFHKHHHPNTCNLAIKKAMFELIGGFWDEEGEDVYLLLKITRKGYKIRYYSQLKIYHHHPKKVKELIYKYFKMGRSASRLLLAFPTSPLMLHRLFRFSIIFLPAIFIAFLYPLLIFIFPYTLLYVYYLKRTRNLKMSFLYPLFDILLQMFYLIGFLTSLIKEIILRVRR